MAGFWLCTPLMLTSAHSHAWIGAAAVKWEGDGRLGRSLLHTEGVPQIGKSSQVLMVMAGFVQDVLNVLSPARCWTKSLLKVTLLLSA
jgi:hypothetical protein